MVTRRLATLLGVAALCAAPGSAKDFSVLIKVGLKDKEPAEWRGTVEIAGGTIEPIRGWRFRKEDGIDEGGAWRLTTDAVAGAKNPQTYPNGIIIDGAADAGGLLRITINGNPWEVPLAQLAFGRPALHETGAASVQIAPKYTTLSGDAGEDDYPSVCTPADGSVVGVWQSHADGQDRLFWATLRDGQWSERQEIPGFAGDLYRPVCTSDGGQGFWVVCSRMDDGDFDLHALHCDGAKWAEPINISDAPGHDFNHAVCADEAGNAYCVWQGFRNGSSDILMARCRNGKWEKPTPVMASPANEWMPAIASRGNQTWVAWDTYLNGSYDIYAAPIVDGKPDDPIAIAASPRFEAKASAAVDGGGRVWIAWQDAGENWGKDSGYTVPKEQRKQALYRERNIKVACISEGRLFMAPDVARAMPERQRGFIEEPRLCCDDGGRVWLAFRHPLNLRKPRGNRIWTERAWEEYVTYLSGDSWAPAMYFPDNLTRIDTFPAIAPAGAGIAMVCHSDNRKYEAARLMTRNTVFATTLEADGPVGEPELIDAEFPEVARVGETEAADLQRAREYAADPGGRELRLLRGDTHRHTEISWDGNGDGSVLDTYRYAMDAVALDFFMVSDHNQQTGVDLEYIRWRNYKLADLHHNPPVFSTLFGFERSLSYPNGHRNIISAKRDYPSFRFTGQQNDLDLLYEYCRRENVIVIPHTIGTSHGTNWYSFDPLLEPVVEIFQGARTNYEYEGAPKSATPGDRQAQGTGYRPQGFLWRAWQRDLRLGIICSSDHGSTHYSYAGVYCEESSREAVIEGIRRRETFGATDNIIIDMRVGDSFMGGQWTQDEPPELEVKVFGTGPIERIELIRDFEFVYTNRPEGTEASFTWMDNDFTPGSHLYYVRVEQADQNIAWGSPVWITKG